MLYEAYGSQMTELGLFFTERIVSNAIETIVDQFSKLEALNIAKWHVKNNKCASTDSFSASKKARSAVRITPSTDVEDSKHDGVSKRRKETLRGVCVSRICEWCASPLAHIWSP